MINRPVCPLRHQLIHFRPSPILLQHSQTHLQTATMVQLAKSTLAALVVVGVQGCTIPAANTASVNLIKSYEGWEPNIYTDPSGNPTVGYGHLCSNSKCTDVPYHIPLSTADGLKLLASDLKVSKSRGDIMEKRRSLPCERTVY